MRSPLAWLQYTLVASLFSVAPALSAGCTEPRFLPEDACDGAGCANDGQADQHWQSDGGEADANGDATVTGADLSWARQLAGTYGIRIRFYSNAILDGSPYEHEIIMLGTIEYERSAGKVRMSALRCKDGGRVFAASLGGAQQDFAWPNAKKLPPQEFEFELRDGAFQTAPGGAALGYEKQHPSECSPGKKLAAQEGQVWLSQCVCGSDALPSSADDCRITDGDDDAKPGITVRLSKLVDGTEYVRVLDSCQMVDGELRADGRHRAKYIEAYDYLAIQCTGNPGTCPHTDVIGCLPELNPVEFEPLTGPRADWNCDDVVAASESGLLFSSDKLAYPEACQRR